MVKMQTAGDCKSFRATFVNEDNGRYLEEGAGLRQAFSFFYVRCGQMREEGLEHFLGRGKRQEGSLSMNM